MLNAVIFDWDGTLVSCEEKINLTTDKLRHMFPEIIEDYQSAVLEKHSSPGWIRKGFVSSLAEDYFTHQFGIIADILSKIKTMSIDAAWSIILSTFKKSYLEVRAKTLVSQEKLDELSHYMKLYVVSNSDTSNITKEVETLGIDSSLFTFIGNAKKYEVTGTETSIMGISAIRPMYRDVLNFLRHKHENLIIVGDNFCLDLVTPISVRIRVAYIPNPLSPIEILQYIKKNEILTGGIDNILDTLIQERKE